MSSNPYLKEIRANLPRLLSLFDNDRTSFSYGIGDRYHWAWGLIDFGNGTFQELRMVWHVSGLLVSGPTRPQEVYFLSV